MTTKVELLKRKRFLRFHNIITVVQASSTHIVQLINWIEREWRLFGVLKCNQSWSLSLVNSMFEKVNTSLFNRLYKSKGKFSCLLFNHIRKDELSDIIAFTEEVTPQTVVNNLNGTIHKKYRSEKTQNHKKEKRIELTEAFLHCCIEAVENRSQMEAVLSNSDLRNREVIAEHILVLRLLLNDSRVEFAERLGTDPLDLVMVENAVAPPSVLLQVIKQIDKIFKLEMTNTSKSKTMEKVEFNSHRVPN